MDILYVVNGFPKLSESFVINELHELDRRGHDISVFAFRRPDEKVTHTELQEMDLTVHYGERPSFGSLPDLLSKRVLNTMVLRQALFVDGPLHHAYYLHLGKQIIEAVEAEGGVDLIHAHFAAGNRIAITYAAAYHDLPCTITAHANEIFSPDSLSRLKRVCSRFDHIIVPSEYNRRYLYEKLDVETDMSVVPATTSVDKFEPSKGCIPGRLLTVARLVEKKGHEYAIDAVAELVEQGYDVEYHIVGTGKREKFLRERVREQGIENHVEFLGHVSDERLLEELHDAAVFVLPCVIASDGDRDVAPVALKEAMATQTACVSTTVSAVPELITSGHDGLLVESNNAQALTEDISKILDDQTLRQKIAENGHETMNSQFNISDVVSNLVSIFKSVAENGVIK